MGDTSPAVRATSQATFTKAFLSASPWASLAASLLTGLLALPSACDLPRDPEGTLREVRGGNLPVAIVAQALVPAEEAALRRLAEDLGATLEPLVLDLHAAVAQLGAREADGLRVVALIGAIPKGTPHAEGAAATRPMGRERFVMLLPPGENGLLLAANRAIGAAEEARRAAAP